MTNMSQTKRAIFASVVVAAIAAAGFGVVAQAQDVVGGIDMQTFTSEMVIDENARVTVTETITGEFQTPHHGIFRSIPYVYEVDGGMHRVSIVVTDVRVECTECTASQEQYTRYGQNDSVVLKIGDPDTLVAGDFVYTIVYEVDGVVLAKEEGTWFTWDAPGDGWEDPFEHVAVHVATPDPRAILDAACTTGAYGSTEPCASAQFGEGAVQFTDPSHLTAAVVLDPTVVQVPAESVQVPSRRNAREYLALLIPVIAFVVMCTAWLRKGRDPAGHGTIIPEYEPPKGMAPGEVGALHDGRVHKHDVIAMIVDLAVRGYIVIEERKKKTFTLVRTAKEEAGLREYEAAFLRTAFGDEQALELGGRLERFGRAWKAAARALAQRMEDDGLFTKNPETVRGGFLVVGGVIACVTWIVASSATTPVPFIAGIVTAGIVLVFGVYMPRRTVRGVAVWEHVQGYKLFLTTAETHRLKWQQQEKIFETYLPYALALGVADVWTRALAPTLTAPPTWFHGAWSTWDAWHFTRALSTFSSSMTRTYAASTSSSRIGGGGFSGGGFGGGGGGGW